MNLIYLNYVDIIHIVLTADVYIFKELTSTLKLSHKYTIIRLKGH